MGNSCSIAFPLPAMEKTSKLILYDLPKPLLLFITEKLPSRADILRLRAACKELRRLIPRPKASFPLSVLTIPLPNGPSPDHLAKFSLTETAIYAIQRPLDPHQDQEESTWILKVRESVSGDQFGRVRLMDPTSRFVFDQNTSVKLPKSFNLMDYQVKDLAKSYELPLDVAFIDNNDQEVRELVTFALSDELNHIHVMAKYNGNKLAVLRNGDKKWTQVRNVVTDNDSFAAFICYKQKFYAIEDHGVTVMVDCNTLNVLQIDPPAIFLGGGSKYFVKSDAGLFLLVNYWHCKLPYKRKPEIYPADFDVYKLDEERNVWVLKYKGYDDRVFFASHGADCSYSISTNEFTGIIADSVYYSDSNTYVKDPPHPGWASVVFRVAHDSKSRPLSICDPVYSKIFWPPPPWLKWT